MWNLVLLLLFLFWFFHGTFNFGDFLDYKAIATVHKIRRKGTDFFITKLCNGRPVGAIVAGWHNLTYLIGDETNFSGEGAAGGGGGWKKSGIGPAIAREGSKLDFGRRGLQKAYR